MYLFLNYFVSRNYHKTFINKRLFLVVLATSYALSAYPMGYLLNIMWLDGVYTLPLIILGIEKIIDNKQPYIYVIALSYGLLTNYYIGYMLCIFSGIYAIYRFTEKWLEKKKISLKQMLKYIIGSFVSVGLSAVVLIPSLLSLGGVKSTQYKFTITPSYPLSHFVIQLLNGTLKYNTNDYSIAGPMVYTGLLVLVVMFFYFINESVPFRFRLLDLGLLLVMVTGSYISGFDKIWHGFNAPEGVPNRYAFIFSFLFLYLAAKNFKHIERVTTFKTLIAAIVFIILICLLYIKHSSIMPLKLVLYNICMLLLLIYAYFVMNKSKGFLKYLFLLLGIIDIGIATVRAQTFPIPATKNTSFVSYYNQTSKVIDKINDKQNIRIGTTFSRSDNDPMLLNYNGLSHYSSSQPMKDLEYLSSLGYYQIYSWAHWINYNSGSTVAADSLLGIRYIVNNSTSSMNSILNSTHLSMTSYAQRGNFAGLIFKYKYKGFSVYENRNAFKIAFGANNIKSGNQIKYNSDQNEFMNLNSIFHNWTLQDIYKSIPYSVSGIVKDRVYKLKPQQGGILYMQIPSSGKQQPTLNANNQGIFSIKVNDKNIGYSGNEGENGIVKLGKFVSGASVNVTVHKNLNSTAFNEPIFYVENDKLVKKIANERNKQHLITRLNNKVITTKGNSSDKYIVYSIPYDNAWHATINGSKVKVERGFGNLISIPVNKGKVDIVLKYIPKGLRVGIFLSSASLIVLCFWSILNLRDKIQ